MNANQTQIPINFKSYNFQWQDRLIAIRNLLTNTIQTQIVYQANYAGNPSNYGGKALTWFGRRLTNINGQQTRYFYNENGIRTRKIHNGLTTHYDLDGSDIISERRDNIEIIRYHYNESKILVGFEYQKQNYFYVRDTLGIITDIINDQGTIVASYTYGIGRIS